MDKVINSSTKFIAIYARVSTARQEEERTIQTQMVAIKEYAEEKKCVIVKEYIDDGWSGDMLARPALDQMRQDAKLKTWEAVLIYDPDRLARRYSYQELVVDELKEAGVEIMFVTTPAPKNGEEKILHGVKGLFAEYERAKISERFRLGKLRKIKEGHILLSEPPYGYDYVPKKENEHGYLVINENEARVIRMIFEWVAYRNFTQRKVVNELKELGIKPRWSSKGVWATSTLTTLLRNKVYIGEAHWGSSYAVVPENPRNNEKYKRLKKSSRKLKPVEEWYTVPTPAIISKELFEQARIQLEANLTLCKKYKKYEYLLAGKIFCSCGKKRMGEGIQGGKHLYYRCIDRVLSFPIPHTCKEKGINAKIADKLVWNKLEELMSSPKLLKEKTKKWLGFKKQNEQTSVSDVDVIKKEISKLKSVEERYNMAYGGGVFSLEKLREYVGPVREKIKGLEKEMGKAIQDENHVKVEDIPTYKEIERTASEAGEVLKGLNFNLKRAIVMEVVEKIIGTQEILHVSGYLPIPVNTALNQYVEFCSINRNRRVAECGEVHIV